MDDEMIPPSNTPEKKYRIKGSVEYTKTYQLLECLKVDSKKTVHLKISTNKLHHCYALIKEAQMLDHVSILFIIINTNVFIFCNHFFQLFLRPLSLFSR